MGSVFAGQWGGECCDLTQTQLQMAGGAVQTPDPGLRRGLNSTCYLVLPPRAQKSQAGMETEDWTPSPLPVCTTSQLSSLPLWAGFFLHSTLNCSRMVSGYRVTRMIFVLCPRQASGTEVLPTVASSLPKGLPGCQQACGDRHAVISRQGRPPALPLGHGGVSCPLVFFLLQSRSHI